MKRWWMLMLVVICSVWSCPGQADITMEEYAGPAHWESFREYMRERQEEDRIKGLSYLISGVTATIGGVVGYYESEDSFSRGLYVIAQSVGVAAIGYGATTYWNGNEYNSFYYAVEGARLSPGQRAELLKRFLDREKDERQKARWIKVATHSLIAVANLYSASNEEDKNVRGVLNFLAGTNAVIAFAYAF